MLFSRLMYASREFLSLLNKMKMRNSEFQIIRCNIFEHSAIYILTLGCTRFRFLLNSKQLTKLRLKHN